TEVGGHDHHAEEQDEGRGVHRYNGVGPRNRAGYDHHGRADDRDASAVDTKSGNATEPEPDVGGDERREGERATPVADSHEIKHTFGLLLTKTSASARPASASGPTRRIIF